LAVSSINQAVFGLYEFFANIIPGMIVLISVLILFPFAFPALGSFSSEAIFLLFFTVLSFVIGLILQAMSWYLTTSASMPSKFYLKKGNIEHDPWFFPEYMKENIRKYANQMFCTPLDAPSQDVFDACVIYLHQNKVQSRVQTFQNMYTLSRCLVAAMGAEALVLFFSAFRIKLSAGPSLNTPLFLTYHLQFEWLFLFGILGALFLARVFYILFERYQKAYAKEVLKSFMVNCCQRQTSLPDYAC
jgi:hypothetical protein